MTTPSAPSAATTSAGSHSAAETTRGDDRFSLFGSIWALFTLTLRQHVRGRRWMIMGVMFLLPAGLAILIRATAHQIPLALPEFLLAWMFIPQILLPLVALVYASGVIQDEQEDQTITYLLMRPLPKWAIYFIKLAATYVTTSILVALFTAITYTAVYAGTENATAEVAAEPDMMDYAGPRYITPPDAIPISQRCVNTIAIHTLAVIAYCSLFGLLSILTRRTLVIGILYIAVVEGVLANMPFGIRLMTVIYYTRLIAYRTMDFLVMHRSGRTENLAAEAWQLDIKKDPLLLAHPEYATCLQVLLIASAVCAVLAAWQCARREFHVKTPEKE